MSTDYEYPTDEQLEAIRTWSHENDWAGLWEFIHDLWWTPEWGWSEKDGIRYISTGGWSGNESLIEAKLRLKYEMGPIYIGQSVIEDMMAHPENWEVVQSGVVG